MPRLDYIPEPWFSFLQELDTLATETVRMDCIGGFVVTMLHGLDRATADVDVLEIAPRSTADAFSRVAMLGGPLFKKYGVYLDRVTVAQPPYEYESRLQEMFPGTFRYLRLMALDPYDLALTKLEILIVIVTMCGTWLERSHSTWACFAGVTKQSSARISAILNGKT